MGRRRRQARKPRQGPGHNEANRQTRESRQRAVMMDAGQEVRFKYFGEEILAEDLDSEQWRPLLQTLWTKGTRQSIPDAKAYIKERQEEGLIDETHAKALVRLVDKFRTVR